MAYNQVEDVVEPHEVLMGMAESLMENQPVKYLEPPLVFKDREKRFRFGGKPPREIFYRKTLLFLTKLPPPVPLQICGCRYLCSGDPATIKCHSCAIYSPTGISLYCTNCFESRHPWHRLPHFSTELDQDENIEHNLKIAHRIAEASRYEKEGNDIKKKVEDNFQNLVVVADDIEIDEKMKYCGRNLTSLEERLNKLRNQLNHGQENASERTQEVELKLSKVKRNLMLKNNPENRNRTVIPVIGSTGDEMTVWKKENDNSAVLYYSEFDMHAISIQKIVRGFFTRKIVSAMVLFRVVKVWTQEYGREFYYDRVTGLSSWTPSKLLQPMHLEIVPYVEEDAPEPLKWPCKRVSRRRSIHKIKDVIDASYVICRFARNIAARKKLLSKAEAFIRRVFDDESGCYYYIDIRTGESSWFKPTYFLNSEPLEFIPQSVEGLLEN